MCASFCETFRVAYINVIKVTDVTRANTTEHFRVGGKVSDIPVVSLGALKGPLAIVTKCFHTNQACN